MAKDSAGLPRLLEIAVTMGRLGCIAFGGPVAHLAHFRRELIERRQWMSDEEFADLVAFCQFLPGPASSQVGMGLGLRRGGLAGMFIAWFCFTMPSVILLLAAAAGLGALSDAPQGWLHGLLAGVVAIVADAIIKMAAKCCPDPRRITIAVAAAITMILVPIAWVQLLVIAGGAMLGFTLPKPELPQGTSTAAKVSSFTVGIGWAILIGAVILPITLSYALGAAGGEASPLAVYAAFAQTGSLVFGGGHVVLPLLQAEVVGPGWMSDPQFLAGYGVTQAMPGPIFTLSAFLGAITGANLGAGWLPFFGFGGLALLGIFAPSFGLVAGLLPLWDRMRALVRVRQALLGVNAAVVGLLLAALYDPVWTKAVAVDAPAQAVAIVIGSWLVLSVWRWPAWLVVALAAAVGTAMQL